MTRCGDPFSFAPTTARIARGFYLKVMLPVWVVLTCIWPSYFVLPADGGQILFGIAAGSVIVFATVAFIEGDERLDDW